MTTRPLLERQTALAKLQSALSAALTGQGRCVLVAGEAGIGKTSLVDVFAVARPSHVRLLWGACEPLLSPRPYGPIYDFAIDSPGLQAALANTGNVEGLQRAFIDALREPAVMVIEDLHWADEATLSLLRWVGPQLATLPVCALVTLRDDALPTDPALAALLDHFTRWAASERLTLAPLTEPAVRELIGGRSLDSAALHRQTAGNPFYVIEALAAPEGSLPRSIRDAVLARVTRLSVTGRAALDAAAILGSRFEPWLLAAVAGPGSESIAELTAAGVLAAQGEGLAFRHDLARQAVLDAIPLPRALSLHRSALTALASRREGQGDSTRLAHHAVGAADPDAIWQYAQLAGRTAAWARAHQAAVAWFERALEHAGGRTPREVAALLDDFAQECDTVDRRIDAVAARERSAALWEACDEPARLGETLARLAVLYQLVGRMPDAMATNTRALTALEPLGPSETLISIYNAQAWLYLGSDASEAGSAIANRALAMAEALGSTSDLARLTEIAGLCELYRDHARGIALLDRSLALALAHDQMTRAGNTYANLGSIFVDFHDFERAAAMQAAGLAFARQHELGSVYAFMEGWQAVLEVHIGAWAAADRTLANALQRPAPSPARGSALLALGRLRTRRGQGEAVEPLRESLEILQRQGFRQREGLIRAALAEAAWEAGDAAQALAEAHAGLTRALHDRQPWYVGELGYWAHRAGQAIALPDWAARPYRMQIAGDWRAAAELWREMGCPYEQARALADGDRAAQIAALKIFERLGASRAAQALRERLGELDPGSTPTAPPIAGLTARQSVVAEFVLAGLTNAEIAARLNLSVKTVDHHVSAILARLDVATRDEAARMIRAARGTP